MLNRIIQTTILAALILGTSKSIIHAEAAPNIQWQKSFGGTAEDSGFLVKTSDGGFLSVGRSTSPISGNKTSPAYGTNDVWIVKLDGSGIKQWEKSYGGSGDESAIAAVEKTSDGGYILGVRSNSDASGNKTSPGRGGDDYWILKLDANAEKQWEKTFGGTGKEFLSTVKPTVDGGYLIGGYSSSGVSGNKTSVNYGTEGSDYWIIKVDGNGTKQWERTYGGTDLEALVTAEPTPDGNYILSGISKSGVNGNKTAPGYGDEDYWIVKLDGNGNKLWDRSFGGVDKDPLVYLRQTQDGGYILAGLSFSGVSGNKTSPGYYGVLFEVPGIPSPAMGVADCWVVKLDTNGNKQWERLLGGTAMDTPRGVQQTADGSYIVSLHSYSGASGNKTSAGYGNLDYWLAKLDSNGVKQWDQTFGGNQDEFLWRSVPTSDGGYILSGYSNSGTSGNIENGSHGANDFWVVKTDASGNKQWDQSFGGTGEEKECSPLEMSDGSYVLSGKSTSGVSGNKTNDGFGGGDFWVIKLTGPVPTPPAITVQPKNRTLPVGANVVFRVTATGTGPLSYTWCKNGVPIPGATGSSYTISDLQTSHSGSYTVFISNSLGNVTSSIATLSVYACTVALSPGIQTFPTSGGTATVSITSPGICPWTVVKTNGWITITSDSSGTGDGSFSYSVAATDGRPRAGFIKVGDQTHAVTQAGVLPAGRFDFNGDNLSDLLLQKTDGTVAAWTMEGTNYLGPVLLRNGIQATGWRAFGVGDFNNDGKADVVFQNNASGKLAAWFMNGIHYISAGELRNGIAPPLSWKAVGAADFNNDGKTDVLLQNSDGRSSVWVMDGTNYLSSLALRNGTAAPAGWRIAGTGDFNGDGQTDIIWQHTDGRIAAWHFIAGTYGWATLLGSGPVASSGTKIRAINDFNGNGKPDFLWHNSTTGITTIWLFNHTTFVKAIPWRNVGLQWQIVGPK